LNLLCIDSRADLAKSLSGPKSFHISGPTLGSKYTSIPCVAKYITSISLLKYYKCEFDRFLTNATNLEVLNLRISSTDIRYLGKDANTLNQKNIIVKLEVSWSSNRWW
jgi:hypothetical protein